MQRQTKKIIIVLLIVLTILIIVTVVSLILLNNKEDKKINYELEPLKEFSVCKNNSSCHAPGGNYSYNYMSLDTDIKEVQASIDKINKETKKLYNKSKKSNMDAKECKEASNTYKHSFHSNTQYYQYENDNYISIGAKRVTYNLCTNESNQLRPEIYIYDKKQEKIISQEEFKKQLNMTEENISSLINFNLMNLNKIPNNNYTLEDTYKDGKQDTLLYYDVTGDLYIAYKNYKDNTYQIAGTSI